MSQPASGTRADLPDSIEPLDFRRALGQFPTGVTVVTTRVAEDDLGMTIGSFSSVSLRPPLVLFSIDRRAQSLDGWTRAGAYGINILAEGQDGLATQFATPLADKWQKVQFRRGYGGAPLIDGAIADFECRPFAQYDGGDHIIFVVEVVRYRVHRCPGPLVFCQGRYNNLRPGAEAPPDWPLPIHY